MKRTVVLLAQIFLVVLAWGQQGPCLKINDENAVCPAVTAPPPADYSAGGNIINFRHENITAGLDATIDARYKAAWIMGDGNYIFPIFDGSKADDIRTLSLDYEYRIADKFNVRTVLIEKKSNTEPPGTKKRGIAIPSIGTSPNRLSEGGSDTNRNSVQSANGNFVPKIAAPESAFAEFSSYARLGGYTAAMAISSPLPITSQSVVLVFYNSVKVFDSLGFKPGALFSMQSDAIATANYAEGGTFFGKKANLPGVFQRIMDGKYENVLVHSMGVEKDKINPSATEYRFFPLFTTERNNTNPSPYRNAVPYLDSIGRAEMQFLVLVLENVQVNNNYNPQDSASQILLAGQSLDNFPELPSEVRDRILGIIDTFAPSLENQISGSELQISDLNAYIRGAYYAKEIVSSAIDPTELQVLSICKSKENENEYEVQMKLTVCNEGNIEQGMIEVELYNSSGLQVVNPQFDNNGLTAFTPTSNVLPYPLVWSFNYPHGLPGVHQYGVLHSDSSCFSRQFSFKTNWDGVKKLTAGNALRAKVHFVGAYVRPIQQFASIALDTASVSQACGYNCGDCEKTDCWWLYVLLFVLALLGWWYWKINKEEGNN